ncbi:MAG: GNAT family N-acetyltransferase [Luteimonas sp.]|nr:GNAT family N-acetyltransferase [Luteimonas sp.]
MVEADAVSVTATWVVRRAQAGDARPWAALREVLWPEEDPSRHLDDAADILGRPERAVAFLAFDERGAAIGFAEATLRSDYVNGTESSPVGFLEGWYVAPDKRGTGIGRALVTAVERWTQQRGCAELGSDALLDNVDSHLAHAACGFEETERVVYFRKRLQD